MPSRRREPQPITKQRLALLINAIFNRKRKYKFTAIRDAFMLYFGWHLGLRPKEIYDARLEHLYLEKGYIYIPAGNNKQRQQDDFPIPEFLIAQLMRYLESRKKFYPENPWLFPSSGKNGRIDRSTFAKMLRKLLRETGLYQVSYIDSQGLKRANITPYGLRHGFGTLAAETYSLKACSILMRHRDLRSSLPYIHIAEGTSRKILIEQLHMSL